MKNEKSSFEPPGFPCSFFFLKAPDVMSVNQGMK